jgi:hypothetical protein
LQARAFLRQLRSEAGIADEQGAIFAQEKVARIAAEIGQVADVDRIADEQAIESFLAKAARKRFAAMREGFHDVLLLLMEALSARRKSDAR